MEAKNQENHRHKYVFRVMYIPCVEGKSIYDDIAMTMAFPTLKGGLYLEKYERHLSWEDHSKPVPKRKLEPFILVHSKLDWIIARYAKILYIKDQPIPPVIPGDPKNPHSNKYSFRGLYFVCRDNRITDRSDYGIYVYQQKSSCADQEDRRTEHKLWEDKTKPVDKVTAEAFYLVPLQLFWMLARYVKDFVIEDCKPMI